VGNAVKYGDEEKDILISTYPTHVDGTPGIGFSVVNAFTGPTDEDCEAWFMKFHRGQSSAGKAGVGLGLYLVREIARAHHGSASVKLSHNSAGTFVTTKLFIPLSHG